VELTALPQTPDWWGVGLAAPAPRTPPTISTLWASIYPAVLTHFSFPTLAYLDNLAIAYDTIDLACAKKLTDSQLSLPCGTKQIEIVLGISNFAPICGFWTNSYLVTAKSKNHDLIKLLMTD